MKTVHRIFSVLTSIVTWAVLGSVLIITAVLFLPGLFHTKPYIVLSGSMEPLISTGSLAYIHEGDEPLQEGDIVGYMAGDGLLVVHRIVGRGEDGWITQGDANEIQDMNEVMDSQVLGKFVRSIPDAGYLLADIRSNTMNVGPFAVPVLIPAVTGVMLLLYLIQYFLGLFVPDTEIKNEKENEDD